MSATTTGRARSAILVGLLAAAIAAAVGASWLKVAHGEIAVLDDDVARARAELDAVIATRQALVASLLATANGYAKDDAAVVALARAAASVRSAAEPDAALVAAERCEAALGGVIALGATHAGLASDGGFRRLAAHLTSLDGELVAAARAHADSIGARNARLDGAAARVLSFAIAFPERRAFVPPVAAASEPTR